MKTMQPSMMVVRRPVKSAISPAMRAPKKVPAERMETMRDFCQEGRAKPLGSEPPLANRGSLGSRPV